MTRAPAQVEFDADALEQLIDGQAVPHFQLKPMETKLIP
jgi:hypothetical protein